MALSATPYLVVAAAASAAGYESNANRASIFDFRDPRWTKAYDVGFARGEEMRSLVDAIGFCEGRRELVCPSQEGETYVRPGFYNIAMRG